MDMLLAGLVVGFSMGCIAGALGVIGFARLNAGEAR